MAEPTFGITVQGNFLVTTDSIMEIVNEECIQALNYSLQDGREAMKQEIEASKAVASKELLNSVQGKIDSLSASNRIFQGKIFFNGLEDERVTGSDVGYGPGKIKGGSRFYQTILAWTATKGIDSKAAYPIMRNLIKYGTNTGKWPQFGRKSFLADGTAAIDKVVKVNFDKAVERIARRMQDANSNATVT